MKIQNLKKFKIKKLDSISVDRFGIMDLNNINFLAFINNREYLFIPDFDERIGVFQKAHENPRL